MYNTKKYKLPIKIKKLIFNDKLDQLTEEIKLDLKL